MPDEYSGAVEQHRLTIDITDDSLTVDVSDDQLTVNVVSESYTIYPGILYEVDGRLGY